MFSGQYNALLNSSYQFSLPKQFSVLLGEGGVVTQGFDRNLMVLPKKAFQDFSERILSMNLTDPSARMLLRLILGNAQVVTPGGSGEMSVPEILIKTVDLKSSLVLVGMGDFFEIWSAQAWSEQESRILESRSDPSRFSSLDLSLR